MIDFEYTYSWRMENNTVELREYRPDVESFIKTWQRAKSVYNLHDSLHRALQKDSGVVTLCEALQVEHDIRLDARVSGVHALVSRAGYWRRRGVPLQKLKWSTADETREEKLARLKALAVESLDCKQLEQDNG